MQPEPNAENATKLCPFCAETILAAARKCRYCGEFLDVPATAQVTDPIESPKRPFISDDSSTEVGSGAVGKTLVGGMIAVVGAIVLLAILNSSDKSAPSSTAYTSSSVVTRIPCVCAASLDSVGPVLMAYKEEDLAALSGLIARGDAFQLAEGTRATIVGDVYGGVRPILIDSGPNIGRRCYLPKNFVR